MATYKPIQSVVLTADTNTVSFIGIDQNYTDLEIVVNARGSHTDNVNFYYRINGDTASNYSVRRLQGNGSSAVSNAGSSQSLGYIGYVDGSNSATGIFGMTKIMINNYTSTTTKNLISKGATAGTNGYAALFISLYRGTSPVTSISLTPDAGNWVAGSTFSLYGIKSGAPQALGGDLVTTDGNYWYHTFRNTGAFTPQRSLSTELLILAGGGAGGGTDGGGGGAGGFRYLASQTLSVPTTITVGAGGTAAAAYSQGTNGINSSVGALSATGGGKGGGGSGPQTFGTAGGSGGGGAGNTSGGSNNYPGGAGNAGGYSPVEGYAGGTGNPNESPRRGAGGGGAGGVGSNGSGTPNGGVGVNTISGTTLSVWVSATGTGVSGYFAGGGGGGGNGGSAGAGGTGGGGAGAIGGNGSSGTANSGGGGGGGGNDQGGGAGGSGLVIVRYPV